MSHTLPVVPIAQRPSSAKSSLSATPNTTVAIPIPGETIESTRPCYLDIWFENGSGALVRGRMTFAPAGTLATLGLDAITDGDDEIGHMPPSVTRWCIPSWATQIIVASNTASAVALVTWLYEI